MTLPLHEPCLRSPASPTSSSVPRPAGGREHWNRGKLRVYAPKTRRARVIDVGEPLRDDLAAYTARTSGQGEIIRFADDRPFGDTGWRNWRARVWKDAAEQFLEGDMRP